MKANDMQVGGDHYRSDLQHWDIVSAFNIPYLEGCASKYVSRWRKKNGLQDLEKALHFATKLKEAVQDRRTLMDRIEAAINGGIFWIGSYRKGDRVPLEVIERFVIANDLEMQERRVLQLLWRWDEMREIELAIDGIQALIREAKRVEEERRGD